MIFEMIIIKERENKIYKVQGERKIPLKKK